MAKHSSESNRPAPAGPSMFKIRRSRNRYPPPETRWMDAQHEETGLLGPGEDRGEAPPRGRASKGAGGKPRAAREDPDKDPASQT